MPKKYHGFTLMELLTVISIIGILATILMPVAGNAIDRARKLQMSKNLQQIAMAYVDFSLNHSIKELNSCNTVNEWAGVLSKYDVLNLASLFISNEDYLSQQSKLLLPKVIGLRNGWEWRLNQDFEKYPLSVVVISGLSPHAPTATTPLAYTRGLDETTGQWRPSDGDNGGVYGTNGGFIVFLDGHVTFYNNLTDVENQLTNYYTGEKTSRIPESVNHGARALSWNGVEWSAQ